MTEAKANSCLQKSRAQVVLEYVLLVIFLCVIALRTTFAEAPGVQSANQPAYLGDVLYSLLISTLLILSFITWFIWSICSKRFLYHFTAMEVGFCLFLIGAVVAGFAAANKRAAITGFITLLAPILMAILLVQILDSHSKIILLLTLIAALGIVSAYRCWEQFSENEDLIKFYEHNRDSVLARQGIARNSLQHWQFEHRLYSKDIRGFFTTSNSTGSFALLASFAAVILFIENYKHRKPDSLGFARLVACGIATAAVIFGLVATRSKGAIIASVIAAGMCISYHLFCDWIKANKRTLIVVCLLFLIAASCAVVLYGATHGTLPGGNSMLVRWQYWQASARMYADHAFTGVGPGNFADFYTHYKPASALETVSDPHNFVLAVLTQYGPLGLAGFAAMILVPLWKVVFATSAGSSVGTPQSESVSKALAVTSLLVVSAALLLIRPTFLKMPAGGLPGERKAAAFVLYVMPVIVFIIGFLLFSTLQVSTDARDTNLSVAALFCAVIGLLIHNLIDFAVFEPGILTTFWATTACLIARGGRRKLRGQFVLKPTPLVKVTACAAGLVFVCAYLYYAMVPVARSTAKIQQAHQAVSYGEFEQAHELLAAAAEEDLLSSAALNFNGQLYLEEYNQAEEKEAAPLVKAEECFLNAIGRSEADFKNYEKLSSVHNLLGQRQKAYDWGLEAAKRYPGLGRLQFELAKIAEQMGETNLAMKHYTEAVKLEDRFRRQFQHMYPGRQIFSRLGEEKYQLAKQRIDSLSGRPTP